MCMSASSGQFADELAELHDGSVSLFLTLPVLRRMMTSLELSQRLMRFEAVIGDHLAQLDAIIGDIMMRRTRRHGDLTRSLFRSLECVRAYPESRERDHQILGIVEEAQLFLMGSCGFALRFARQAGIDRSVHVLETSMERIASVANDLTTVTDRFPVGEQALGLRTGVDAMV